MPKTPVFVSWSGDRSKAVAVALCDWLRLVLQTTDPWCSPEIAAGDRWSNVVADRLHKSSVGVIVVTVENQAAPWLLFEAGALSKIVDRGKVIPFYVGLKPTDVQGPLSQFQGKVADKDGTLEMLEAVNASIEDPQGDKALADLFDMWWPKLEGTLAALPKPEKAGKKRPVDDMVEEVLTIVRRIENPPPKPVRSTEEPNAVLDIDSLPPTLRRVYDAFPKDGEPIHSMSIKEKLGITHATFSVVVHRLRLMGVKIEMVGPGRYRLVCEPGA